MGSKKCLFVVFAFVALILTSAISSVLLTEVKAQETTRPVLQFEQSDLTIGVLGQDLPTPLTTINVTVANVTNLSYWQIKVYFDQSILSFESKTAAVQPPSDIDLFAGHEQEYNFVKFVGTDARGRYVQAGGYLNSIVLQNGSAIYPSVSGSGVLAQLNFKGVSSGSSYLNFSGYGTAYDDTILLNSSEVGPGAQQWPIAADVFNAKVTVLGNGLSMVVEPEVIEIGGATNITGLIFPRQDTSIPIAISYMLNGTDTEWKPLATVQTDRFNINETYYVTGYAYTWTPDKVGFYFLKADGGGFVSQEKTLTVNASSKPPPPNLWLLYGPPVAFAGAVVGVAFLWDRRRRHSNRMILP